ncbi:MAG: hypothetical protein KC668_07525, partial [Myxococcales bacterium]|nr:hypothetical protein [Myxococcales bacterium]
NMPAPQRQCATYRNVQYDVMTRYVDGILALRPGQRPDFTIFATISGVDPDVLDANSRPELVNGIEVTTVDIEAILADASMIERANAQNNDLEPSCVRPNPMDPGNANLDNEAYPPRRLLEVTRGLIEAQAGGVVASICQARDAENGDYTADFSDAVQSIVARIAASLPTSCLPRPLIRGGDNTVFCQILEVLPEGSSCAEQEARGREPEAVRMEGTREVCRVNQVVPTPENIANGQEPSGLGWFYDDYSAELDDDCFRFEEDNRQQIRFTTGAESIPGAKFRLECVSPVVPTGDVADIGSECAGGNQAPCDLDGDDLASFRSRYDREGASLVCDNVTNTCQFACATDADCPGGNVCFGSDDGNEGNNAYCVSPTCQF